VSDIAAPTGLFDRAIRRITNVWREMAAGVSREEDDSVTAQMSACLSSRGGEVSARNRAAKLAQSYLQLSDDGRVAFLRSLAGFDSDHGAVAAAYEGLQTAKDEAERAHA
jgi:malonyl-CoA decarboxylase